MSEGFLDGRGKLKGKIAVIVGGGGGFVANATTLNLARAGVDLVICDRDKEGLAAIEKQVAALGVRVKTLCIDVMKSDLLSGFFDMVEAEHPEGVDILVNIAGGTKRRSFKDTEARNWPGDIHRNFGYCLESIHRTIPLMNKRGGGSIINFTTIEAHRGAPGFSVYAGAKAALTNFTRSIAVELGAENIRVNTVAPDSPAPEAAARMMQTLPKEMQEAEAALTPEQRNGARLMYIPMGRAASLEDVANTVLFLASDLSASLTGQTLHVDGGTSASLGFVNWPEGVGWLPSPRGKALEVLFPNKKS